MIKSSLIKFTGLVICFLCLISLNAQETIKVGVFQNFPLVHKDNSGAPSGIYVDLINEISQKENWKIEYVFNTWNQSLENLKDSKLDIITGITFLPEREEFIDYNNEAVITVWGVVCATKNTQIQNILDLKSKKIAIIKGEVNGINFSKLSEKFELNCEFIELDSYNDVMESVKTNTSDAGVIHNVYSKSNLEKYNLINTPILFNPNKILFAVPKGKNKELIVTIDKYLHTWKNDSNSPYHIILEKWYGESVIDAFQLPKWVKRGGLFIIGAFLVVLFMAYVFRKLVKIKTQELFQSNIKLQKEIEAKERTKKILHESEEKFKALYHESPDMLVSTSPINGTILQCNKTFLQKTGYLREEVIGTHILKMYHDDCLFEVKNLLYEFDKTGEVSQKELILKTKEGNKIDISLNVKSVRDKTGEILFSISSWRDISSWKKTQLEIRKSEERYSRLLKNLEMGIVVHAPDTAIILSNKKASELLGLSEDQLKSKVAIDPYWKFIDQNNIPIALEDYPVNKIIRSKKPFNNLILGVIRSELHDVVWLTVSGFLEFDGDNEIEEIVISFIEITQQKKVNEEIEKLNVVLEDRVAERTLQLELSEGALLNLVDDLNMQTSAFDTANKKLVSINSEMETFTYSVSHDLKAPLRGIDGYSKLLLDLYKNDLNEEAQGFLKNIRTGTAQMNLLIEDLLSYSRLERQEFEIRDIQLQPLINDLLVLLSGEIKKSNIQIKTTFPVDFVLLADTNGLKLVIRNLLDNAIKFSSKSKKPEIEVGSSENSTHWLIFVRDNGVGFDMKYHDRIFKIFQRLHLPEEYEGTGIGLAMVEKAMYRMNGRIWAESELNKGTCFYLEFKK